MYILVLQLISCKERLGATSAMQAFIIFSAITALAAAYPVYLLEHEVHVPLAAKSTITKSSQVVDHGSTIVHSVPVVHATPVSHAPIVHVSVPSKTTVTKSSQSINHGSTLHAVPVMTVHVPVYHKQKTTVTKSSQVVAHGSTHAAHSVHAPVVHMPVVVHSFPLVTLKTGDSAVSHHSSTVHETEPVVAVHH